MPRDFVFLNAGPTTTKRDRELVDTQIKSHSARYGHAARKARAKGRASATPTPPLLGTDYDSRRVIVDQSPSILPFHQPALQLETSLFTDSTLGPSFEYPIQLQREPNSRSSSLTNSACEYSVESYFQDDSEPSSRSNSTVGPWLGHGSTFKRHSRSTSPSSAASSPEPIFDDVSDGVRSTRGNSPGSPRPLVPDYLLQDSPIPTNIFPITLDSHDYSIIRYYLQFGVANTRRTEAMARSQPLDFDFHSSLAKYKTFVALTEDASTYALLATTSARISQMGYNADSHSDKASFYIGCAINKLRRDISDENFKPNLTTMKTITRLASAEWARGNQKIAQYHMTSMSKMTGNSWDDLLAVTREIGYAECLQRYDINMAAEWGGMPKIHRPPPLPPMTTAQYSEICERLDNIQLDVSAGMTTGLKVDDLATHEDRLLGRTRPFLLNSKRLSPSSDPDLIKFSSRTIRASFARGFPDLILHNVLCEDFNKFLLDLVPQWTDLLLLCFSTGEGSMLEHAAWLDDRAIEALGDLCLLQRHTALYPRQDALRLTLIMILVDLTSPFHWRAVASNLERLKETLEFLEATQQSFEAAYFPSTVEGAVMLWVFCVGLCAAAADGVGEGASEEINWWRERAISLCLLMRVHRMTDLYAVMVKYIHGGLVQHVALVDLMDHVSARISRRDTSQCI